MTQRPFGQLTELAQARRLRPLAVEALTAYDIEWTGLHLITNGWNGVFRVDTSTGPRVLRITLPVPGAIDRSVSSEVEFMTALAANSDLVVPRIAPNRRGEPVTLASAAGVPEARECVIFDWLGGPNLASRTTPANWAALGELMAKMHRFAEGWTPSSGFTTPVFDSVMPYGEPLVVFEPGRIDLLGLEDLLREATDVTDKRISALHHTGEAIVVHADLHQWNVKIQLGVLAPFDFEDLLWAAPVLDVATSLYYVHGEPGYAELARAFKSGYERQRPWVEREPGQIDRLMFARALLLLNSVVLDASLDIGDREAFVRRRETYALLALDRLEPFEF